MNALKHVLNCYCQLRSLSVEAIAPISSGFSGAQVFRVDTVAGSFCLRRWPTTMPLTRLKGIHRLTAAIFHHGVSFVAVPLQTEAGETWLEDQVGIWQVEPWLPGEPDSPIAPSLSKLSAGMKGLARWHQAAAVCQPRDEGDDWIKTASSPAPSLTVRDRQHQLFECQALLPKLDEELRRESHERFLTAGQEWIVHCRRLSLKFMTDLNAVAFVEVPHQPCLRDVWSAHLLYTGDCLTGLIDYGAIRTDTIACDFARLFGTLVLSAGQHAAMLAAYESVRPLSAAECSLISPLERSGILLSGLTWLRRRYLDRTLPVLTDRICERIEHFNRRLSQFNHQMRFL